MQETKEYPGEFPEQLLQPEITEEEARAEVLRSIEETGCKEKVSESVVERLAELSRFSRYFFDSVMISRATSNIVDFITERYSNQKPQFKLSLEQKARGRLAALLHDVGKTGPGDADHSRQQAVLALFRIETRRQSETGLRFADRTVGDVVSEQYPAQAESILQRLRACGIGSGDRMLKFWNSHSYWTKEVLESDPGELSHETRVIAASHHIDKGHDPYGILDNNPISVNIQTRAIGAMEEYTAAGQGYAEALEQRVLLAADKYQAAVRRSDFGHREAFQSLRAELAGSYDNDEIMTIVFEAIDELGKQGEIFK